MHLWFVVCVCVCVCVCLGKWVCICVRWFVWFVGSVCMVGKKGVFEIVCGRMRVRSVNQI